MKTCVRKDHHRNAGQLLTDSLNHCECWGIVQRRKLRRIFQHTHYFVSSDGGLGHVFAAMHDAVCNGVDSYCAKLAQPIQGADGGGLMVSDPLGLLELVTTFIAHPDDGMLSDFLKSPARKQRDIFRRSVLIAALDFNQLKL
jgi:hypothetical protein